MFLDDGEVPLDNNATEGALRSFCLHKHAWKLIDSIDGAKSSAIIYSITETAKANHLNPFRYLPHVLTVLKDHQDDTDYCFIEDLLPWSDQLPESCRSKVHCAYIMEHCPKIRQLDICIREFRNIYDQKNMVLLYLFIEKYKLSEIQELSRFAERLEKDIEVVENSVASPLSNGFAEGTNNKLKMVKCTMYGRCSRQLLEAKLMYRPNV